MQVLVDGSDTVVQSAAVQLAQMPLDSSAVAWRRLQQRHAGRRRAAIRSAWSRFYNPERRSAINIVPGLIGVILTMTMVLFTGVAIVRERERGNMEMLIATPVSRSELMVGKVLPYAAIGLLQTTVVLVLGVWLFQVPVRGGVLDVYLAAVLLILANLTLGLLISTKRAIAVPGDADDVLRLPAVDPAVGIHVPVRRHAGCHPVAGRSAAADAFPAASSAA